MKSPWKDYDEVVWGLAALAMYIWVGLVTGLVALGLGIALWLAVVFAALAIFGAAWTDGVMKSPWKDYDEVVWGLAALAMYIWVGLVTGLVALGLGIALWLAVVFAALAIFGAYKTEVGRIITTAHYRLIMALKGRRG